MSRSTARQPRQRHGPCPAMHETARVAFCGYTASHSAAWVHNNRWKRMEVRMNFVVAFILYADRDPTVRNEHQRARGQDHFVEHPKRRRKENVGNCRGY
jgi:hypothetical protein